MSAGTQLRMEGLGAQEVNVRVCGDCGEMRSKRRNQPNSAQSISWFLSTTTDPPLAGVCNLLCLGLVK